MLCRCSQQERVIALGVWSSLRRIGSSGQSCQGLPKDSPGCVYMCVHFLCVFLSHGSKNNIISLRMSWAPSCASRAACLHTRERGKRYASINKTEAGVCAACVSSPRRLTTASSRPAGSLDSDIRVPGTCQRHHMCPKGPWNLLDAWAITLQ